MSALSWTAIAHCIALNFIEQERNHKVHKGRRHKEHGEFSVILCVKALCPLWFKKSHHS